MEISEFQKVVRETYGGRDAERGVEGTFAWFVEEVGELSRAIFREDHDAQLEEFSDVLAWLVTLADLTGIDMTEAANRYATGCPKCTHSPCTC